MRSFLSSNCMCIYLFLIVACSLISSYWLSAGLQHNELVITQFSSTSSSNSSTPTASFTVVCQFGGYQLIEHGITYSHNYYTGSDSQNVQLIATWMIITIVIFPVVSLSLLVLLSVINKYHFVDSALLIKYIIVACVILSLFMFLVIYSTILFINQKEKYSICHEHIIATPITNYILISSVFELIVLILDVGLLFSIFYQDMCMVTTKQDKTQLGCDDESQLQDQHWCWKTSSFLTWCQVSKVKVSLRLIHACVCIIVLY